MNFLIFLPGFICLTVIIVIFFYFSKSYSKKLHLITKFTSKLSLTLDINRLLPQVVDEIMSILKPTRCSIMLLNSNEELKIKYGKNISSYAVRGLKLKIGEGIAGKALEKGIPIVVRNVAEAKEYYKLFDSSYKSVKEETLVVIPLKFQEQKYGVINLHYPPKRVFPKSETEKFMLKIITEQLSSAIHNCITYQNAVSDNMTKLYNHTYFIERLKEEIFFAKKFSTKLSLILLDIDHFKQINDTYGHQIGDIVLIEIATILKNSLRLNDIAGRYGGEEFGIILPNTNKKEAISTAERLRKTIEENKIFLLDGRVISVTCSFGVTEFEFDESIEKFLQRTDKILYTAKNFGRNRVCS